MKTTIQSKPRVAGEAAHTPTPWKQAGRTIYSGRFIVSLAVSDYDAEVPPAYAAIDVPQGDDEALANAAFIVRAVNSHAALVAALELAEHDRRTNHWRAETTTVIRKALEGAK